MYFGVTVGSFQGKSRFTVAEGGILVLALGMRIGLKDRWDISWFKNSQRVQSLPNQPNLFLILRVIYDFAIKKSNHSFLHILHHFY